MAEEFCLAVFQHLPDKAIKLYYVICKLWLCPDERGRAVCGTAHVCGATYRTFSCSLRCKGAAWGGEGGG